MSKKSTRDFLALLESREDRKPGSVKEDDWRKVCSAIPGLAHRRKIFRDGKEWKYDIKRKTRAGKDRMDFLRDGAAVVLSCAFCGEPVRGEHTCERKLSGAVPA